MSRRYKKRRFHFGVFLFFLTVVVIAGVFFIPWVMKPEKYMVNPQYRASSLIP